YGTYSVAGDSLVTVTNNYKYTFEKGTDNGTLNYKVEKVTITLKKFIEGTLDGGIVTDTLSLTDNMPYGTDETTADMAATSQTKDTLNINLNGHKITKNTGVEGEMTISTGAKTLNIDGGTDTAGSMDTNFNVNDENGKLNVSGNTELTGTIDNLGEVTFAGTTTVEGILKGSGVYTNDDSCFLTVENAANLAMENGLANAGTLNLGEGELGANITGAGTTIIDGEVTSAKNIENKVTLADGKKLTNTGEISGEVTNAGTFITTANGIIGGVANSNSLTLTEGALASNITGEGTTTISGTVTNTNGKTITQNSLVIANTGSLTSDVDKLVIGTGDITDNGALILTGEGDLAANITGAEGTTTIDGEVTSAKAITQKAVTVNSGKSLTMTADLTAAVTVNDNAKLDIGAANLKADVTNSGTVDLQEGTLGQKITGGLIQIKGNVSSVVGNILGVTNTVDENRKLTFTDTATLEKKIDGDGEVVIGGLANTVTSIVDNLADIATLTVNTDNTLEFTSGNLSREVANAGTVKLNGATLGGAYVKNGTLEFAANTIVADAGYIAADTNKIGDGKTVIVKGGELKKDITGTGTVQLGDNSTLSVFTDQSIAGTLNGNGQTLNMSDSTNINKLTVGKLTGNINLQLDVDMSNFTSDQLAATTIDNGAQITVDNINIVKDYVAPATLELPKEEDNKIVYITENNTTPIHGDYSVNVSGITATNNYIYSFSAATENGKLKYKVEASDITFKKFIEGTLSDATTDPATLSLTENMTYADTEANMAEATQTNAALTINLNGHQITKNTEAMTISTGG
ncbi:MAG: hypothetical protein KBS60_03090, partial [Phascolarctobacterium sp.]|nr:hypothetical protein [Candidatus Phascolarctobacterium caballi]